MHRRTRTSHARIAAALLTAASASVPADAFAEMELAPPPRADFERSRPELERMAPAVGEASRPEMAPPPNAGYERSNPEIDDSPPADDEASDPDIDDGDDDE